MTIFYLNFVWEIPLMVWLIFIQFLQNFKCLIFAWKKESVSILSLIGWKLWIFFSYKIFVSMAINLYIVSSSFESKTTFCFYIHTALLMSCRNSCSSSLNITILSTYLNCRCEKTLLNRTHTLIIIMIVIDSCIIIKNGK